MSYAYKKVKLPDGTTRDEHRLIMENILGRKLEFDEVVHHKDENKRNNDPSNLEVKSRSEHSREHFNPEIRNMNQEIAKQKISEFFRGSKAYSAILTEEKVLEIKKRLVDGDRSADLAREFGVSPKTIGSIKRNETWKHVTL